MAPSAVPRAVLFDMDGVLVDSTGPHLRAWKRFLDANGIPTPSGGIASLFGRPASEAIRLLLGEHAGESGVGAKLAELERYSDALLNEHAPGGLVVPGAAELVNDLIAAGWRLALVTSAQRATAERSLGDLHRRFEAVVTAGDVPRGKPDPAAYLAAAAHLATAPSDCVVVEDAVVGVQAGRRAGMDVIAVSSTAAPEDLWAAGARQVVADLTELRRELMRLWETTDPTTMKGTP